MINVLIKQKFVIVRLEVTKLERFIPFDLKLPANVVKVTGVTVTASKI